MQLINTSEVQEKKSKFIGYLYQIDNIDEAKSLLNIIKKEHNKAKHIVYAYIINNTAKKCDDKEPSGTAGTPIYNVLERNQLHNHIIVVVRYFGGTLLGTGLLTRCYSKCSNQLIINK